MFMSSEYKPYLNNKIFKIKKNSTLLYRRYMEKSKPKCEFNCKVS